MVLLISKKKTKRKIKVLRQNCQNITSAFFHLFNQHFRQLQHSRKFLIVKIRKRHFVSNRPKILHYFEKKNFFDVTRHRHQNCRLATWRKHDILFVITSAGGVK